MPVRADAANDTTEGIPLDGQRSVLIVDSSQERREVLQTALERRGLRILAANRACKGLELARQHHPDLIVLDLEADDEGLEKLSAPFAEQSREDAAPLVLLGSVRRPSESPLSGGEFVRKPYHYGPLVRKIEELLERRSNERGSDRVIAVRDSRERPGYALRAG
jgi:DNA-binding response OmpR family regulator